MDTLRKDSYDAVVVGTGFGGAVAACRLAQAGVDVAVLERGRRFPPGSFPRQRYALDRERWLQWVHGGPYDVRPLHAMLVVQAAGYGGGSLVYANVQMRPPPAAFDRGWPAGYSRAALDPYYDLVAHMLDARPVPHDGACRDPATGAELVKLRMMEGAAARLGRRAQTFRPNLAVRFEGAGAPPVPNRFGAPQSGCVHCGECDLGCNAGAKNTLDLNYLALAERHGADVATRAEVTWLAPNVDGDGYQLRVRDHAAGRAERTLEAREVFLCLGAVNTTELLLRCRDQYRTLPRLSPALGHGYSGNGDFLAFALGTEPAGAASQGPTITTACVYDGIPEGAPDGEAGGRRLRFVLEDGGFPRQLARLVPWLHPIRLARQAGGDAWRHLRHGGRGAPARAAASLLQAAGDSTAVFLAMGADLANGRIELARPGHRLRVRWDARPNRALYDAEAEACREFAEAMGGEVALAPNWRLFGQPASVHNLGGCRMADAPDGGVVDADGRVFGYPGLFVLDGGVLPAAVGVNPSQTIAAVAERGIERAIRRRPGLERWQAPEAADAPRGFVPEDAVVPSPLGLAVRTRGAAALRFRETMRGACVVAGAERAVRVELTIAVDDVGAFVADPAHRARATGRVHVAGLTAPAGAAVEDGAFHLFPDEPPTTGAHASAVRTMRYALPFRAADGRPWVLRGIKHVRGRRAADLWRATTTLAVTLEPAEGDPGAHGPAEHQATGTLRLGVPAVARLIASMRTPGPRRRRDAVVGRWRFVRFFAGTVVGLYRAGRR